ncbi:hypothetical protein Mgra_00006037 [Meloidogyne graminicola]|uniref:Calponin-homology (CH) domain-containing protein n=1 Tax=Meloidogyne graminicola TaxID=189291 RepID=A0A8S9ZN37_9BILA|nr:hypothetical protein Mgra_00006037 [Meloidogyne graminicola]
MQKRTKLQEKNKTKKENDKKSSLHSSNSSLAQQEGEESTLNKKQNSNRLKRGLQGLKQRFIRRCCCCHCYPKMMQNSKSSDEEYEAEQRMQKNTFTRWVNYHLEEHSSSGKVQNLIEDLKDGILLCHLLEVLTGDVLPVITNSSGENENNIKSSTSNLKTIKTLKRAYKLNNLNTALKCLRAKDVKLVTNNVVDLADGNPRIWLGLIWQIILHFQIETGLSLVRRSTWHQIHSQQNNNNEFEGTSIGTFPSTSKLPPLKKNVEQALLDWLNREAIRPRQLGLPSVVDLDKSWKDGRLLLALLHRFLPALINFEEILEGGNEPEECRKRALKAIQLARLHLGISPFLDPTELCAPGRLPCRRSVITYISQYLNIYKLKQPLIKEEEEIKLNKEKNKNFELFKNLFEWLNKTNEQIVCLKLSEKQRPTIGQFKLFCCLLRKEWLEKRKILIEEQTFPLLNNLIEKNDLNKFNKLLDNIQSCISSWDLKIAFLLDSYGKEIIELEKWISNGEYLIYSNLSLINEEQNNFVNFGNEKLDELIDCLEEKIKLFEEYFKELPNKRLLLISKLNEQQKNLKNFKNSSNDDFLLLPQHLLINLNELKNY